MSGKKDDGKLIPRSASPQIRKEDLGDADGQNGRSWWNQISFRPWNVAANPCGSTDKDIIDWCGTTSESENFVAAVNILLAEENENDQHFPPTRIKYCRQFERWDCGIACIIMILRWLREDREYPDSSELTAAEAQERAQMLRMVGSTSIWTADLVLLIHQLFLQDTNDQQEQQKPNRPQHHRYLFCSKMLEVDVGHRDLSYYKAAFSNDEVRVSEKFAELGRLNASMLRMTNLPLGWVLNVVDNNNCVAIVLVDTSTMFARSSRHNHGEKQDFCGHYVVLCGITYDETKVSIAQSYDSENNGGETTNNENFCLEFLDPGKPNIKCVFATPKRFEKAWKATGTDDDIIFIAKDSLKM